MGDPKRPQSKHPATLAEIIAGGIIVKRICKVCGRSLAVDLEALRKREGGACSLWDFFTPCDYPDCPDGLMIFFYSTGAGTPFRPMKTYNVFRTLDGMGWEFLPMWPGQPPFMNGIEHSRRSPVK